MQWCREDFLNRPLFHHFTCVHHQHMIGDLRHHGQAVGDEYQSHAQFPPQLRQQLEHLCLYRDIERGRRFVGDQQARVVGNRHCDHRTLPHAARQLVRIGARVTLGIRKADA